MTYVTHGGSSPRLWKSLIACTVLTILSIGATFIPAQARTAPTSSTASIALTTANPAFAGPAAFSIVDPPTKNVQEVSVSCAQNGNNVYLDVHTQNQASWLQFTLWSQTWANAGGGSANCVAQLYYYTWQGKRETGLVVEAQTSFVAA